MMKKEEIDKLEKLIRKNKKLGFIIFFCFLVSFILIRISTAYIALKYDIFFYVGEYHIHHFYIGIGLIIISSWIAIFSFKEKAHYLAAAFFGIGLGIFVDEVGLLLNEMTEYWAEESYTAFIILCLTILTLMLLDTAWLKRELKRLKIG